ncbi:MAG: thioredoxin family protein [Mycobacterium sp.]|nr:thioredoxin family protein [Mycobacterium sp.]
MTPLLISAVAIAATLALATLAGALVNRRAGALRETTASTEAGFTEITSDLGLSGTGPTIVHFSAVWCGPCAGVRRVVNQVCADLNGQGHDVAHVEIDMDADPAAARRLSVLSLPTTFIFDADGRQRYRTSGVPKAVDLRSVLVDLLA